MFSRRLATSFLLLILTALAPINAQAELKPHEGFIDVTGGKVWYHVEGSGNATPLVMLHGGPGIPSCYLNPLRVLADQRPVIFYDQLGCGKSPAETDSTDWTIDRFVAELEQVRAALGLDQMYLYGHSWGSILAVEYALAHPDHVKGLILAGPALNLAMWIEDANILRATLPDSVQAVIEEHGADGTTDAPEYQAAINMYYEMYVARNLPWSADLDTAFSTMNPALYGYMCGPSEFAATGILKSYDITGRLGEIKVPTLVSIGEFDEARKPTAEYYTSLIPGARLVVVPNAAHVSVQDNIEPDAKNLRAFLMEVDGN